MTPEEAGFKHLELQKLVMAMEERLDSVYEYTKALHQCPSWNLTSKVRLCYLIDREMSRALLDILRLNEQQVKHKRMTWEGIGAAWEMTKGSAYGRWGKILKGEKDKG